MAAAASVSKASSLLAQLERGSLDLVELVRRTPRADDGPGPAGYLLRAGGELMAVNEKLEGLVFTDNYTSTEEQLQEVEKECLGEIVLSPEEVIDSLKYKKLTGTFSQDIEKSKNIGTQRTNRLLVSFEHFKNDQETAFRRKMHKLKHKSGIDKLLHKVISKERQLEKLAFELRSKRELLSSKNRQPGEKVSSEDCGAAIVGNLREVDSRTYAEKELCRLLLVIAEQTNDISETLSMQGECESVSSALRSDLGDIVLDLSQRGKPASTQQQFNPKKLNRLKANRKRYANSAHVELDMLDDSFGVLNKLVDGGAKVQRSIALVESEIKVKQETLEVLGRTDACRELKRIRALCDTLQSQTAAFNSTSISIEKGLLALNSSSGLLNFESYEGKQFVSRCMARKSNREATLREAKELRIKSKMPKPKPDAVFVPLELFNFHISPQELSVAMQASCLLKSRLHSNESSPFEETIGILTSSKLQPDVGLLSQKGNVEAFENNPHMEAMVSIGIDDSVDLVQDDHGLPAILDQLQTLEDMLVGAPNRKPYDTSGGMEEIRERLVEAKQQVVESYKAIKVTTNAINKLESDQGNSLDERDSIRATFLAKISGRESMPLTITARQDEVNHLTGVLLETQENMKRLRKQIHFKTIELENAQTLHDKLKATPGLAALEVDNQEKAKASKPLIRVEVKPKTPGKASKQRVPPSEKSISSKSDGKDVRQDSTTELSSSSPLTTESSSPKSIIRVRIEKSEPRNSIEHELLAAPVPELQVAEPESLKEPQQEIQQHSRVSRSLRVAPVVDIGENLLAPRGPRRDRARSKYFSVFSHP